MLREEVCGPLVCQLRCLFVPAFAEFRCKAVIEAFHEEGARYMIADWTGQDPAITAALEAQGRSGVPLYLYYAEGAAAPQVLPQILSVDGVIETLREGSS